MNDVILLIWQNLNWPVNNLPKNLLFNLSWQNNGFRLLREVKEPAMTERANTEPTMVEQNQMETNLQMS